MEVRIVKSQANDLVLTARERIAYEPIHQRKPFILPDNKRVAVWVIVNVENWLPQAPQPRTVLPPPMGVSMLPDVPNWCWHEYGMRVGFWRFYEVLQKRGVPVTLAINGSACELYKPACEAALEANWEFMGHGYVQKPMHRVENQVEDIQKTIDAIKKFTGKAPLGWESPGIAETEHTLDYLQEAGIQYVADWVLDDQPVTLKTRSGNIVSVPYTVEINDVVMSAIQLQSSDEIYKRGREHFDRLYLEGETIPRVMAITIHPYLTGAPHRIRYLELLLDHILSHDEVLMCTGGEIMDIYRSCM